MVLKITLISGSNLPKKKIGHYDYYVKVKAGPLSSAKTQCSESAQWNQTVELQAMPGKPIQLSLKDTAAIKDAVLGEGEISSEHVCMPFWEGEVQLKAECQPCGSLRVRLENSSPMGARQQGMMQGQQYPMTNENQMGHNQNAYPPGSYPQNNQYNNYPASNPGGYPPSNMGGYPPGAPGGYPAHPSTGGYPAQPSMGGYPAQPSMGGYPAQPSMGGYPPQPSMGGYPAHPSTGGYPPSGYPPMGPGGQMMGPPGMGAGRGALGMRLMAMKQQQMAQQQNYNNGGHY